MYVVHEKDETYLNPFLGRDKELDGLVTGLFTKAEPNFDKWDIVMHQTRHPLKVITSAMHKPIHWTSIENILDWTNAPKHCKELPKQRLYRIMYAYVHFFRKVERLSVIHFQVEQIREHWIEILHTLQVASFQFPSRIPSFINTTAKPRRELTWADLTAQDPELTEEILRIANRHGY
jgi:hypothetical protein